MNVLGNFESVYDNTTEREFMYVRVLKIYLNVQNIVVRKSRTFDDCDIQKNLLMFDLYYSKLCWTHQDCQTDE